MIRALLLLFIKLYQKTISPDHGVMKYLNPHGYCRYSPSCSEYARVAIVRHGALRGGVMACKRLLRCHPWAKGGVDEVPPFFNRK